jgi:hypothetical protein
MATVAADLPICRFTEIKGVDRDGAARVAGEVE